MSGQLSIKSPAPVGNELLRDQNGHSSNKNDGIQKGTTNTTGRRRRWKSSLYLACWSASLAVILSALSLVDAFSSNNHKPSLSQRKNEWIERSVQYYSTVMRKNSGQQIVASAQLGPSTSFPEVQLTVESDLNHDDIVELDKEFVELATKHYYARFLIKMGKWSFAEKIYRRIIDELSAEGEEDCDHTKLAVSTLLLALHMQRTGDIKATRAVFLNFFRRVALAKESDEENHKCTCSAKVLQAYALFEMKNGHANKSLEIIQLAVKMDEKLKPVLEWKQFRDAAAGRSYEPTFRFRSRGVKTDKEELRP